MPFRDELQAAYDKIAALEQQLRESQTNPKPETADPGRLLREALDTREKEGQSALEAKVKELEYAVKRAHNNAEQIQRQANAELEALAGLSRARALVSYQSQLGDLQTQTKQSEARLSLPPPPTQDDTEREVQQALRKLDEDILAAIRARAKHLERMCATLNQPPQE